MAGKPNQTTRLNAQFQMHYVRSGAGIVEAVCQMFRNGAFVVTEGDALLPVQEAYRDYLAAHGDAGKTEG